jgi:hypothetical protein
MWVFVGANFAGPISNRQADVEDLEIDVTGDELMPLQ